MNPKERNTLAYRWLMWIIWPFLVGVIVGSYL